MSQFQNVALCLCFGFLTNAKCIPTFECHISWAWNVVSRVVKMTTGKEAFVSRQIEGKGIGVIALRNIKQGELIISEEPLLIIPWWVRHSVYPG